MEIGGHRLEMGGQRLEMGGWLRMEIRGQKFGGNGPHKPRNLRNEKKIVPDTPTDLRNL